MLTDIETFRQITLPLVATVLVLGGGIAIAIVAVVLAHLRARQRDEMAVSLKMEMIERDMSPEEIDHVLHAELKVPQANPVSQHAG